MDLLIVTGYSGAGKSKAIESLEDLGYFCVDNIPADLLLHASNMLSDNQIEKIAIVTDSRCGKTLSKLQSALSELNTNNIRFKLLFLEAAQEVLVKRYKETRRKHPLIEENESSLEESIAAEYKLLSEVRQKADFVIDTSALLPAELKTIIADITLSRREMYISVMSFGFKLGLPPDSDLVFDVRCLPNPFYLENLRNHTGLESCVSEYIFNSEDSRIFRGKIWDILDFTIPLYLREGKSQLTISVGCTGGKHRSVAMAEEIADFLEKKGYKANTKHRDIEK